MLELPELTSQGVFRMLEVPHKPLECMKPVTDRNHNDEAQHRKYCHHKYDEQDKTFHAHLRAILPLPVCPIVQRARSFRIGLLPGGFNILCQKPRVTEVECVLPVRTGNGERGFSHSLHVCFRTRSPVRGPMTNSKDANPLFNRKGTDPGRVAAAAARNPEMLASILEGLAAKEARVRYGCAKVLLIISENWPLALYPRFDFLAGLLDSENKILQWNATWMLANLTTVDSRNKFERIFNRYFAPIPGPVMITGANVIGAAARIAKAKPSLSDRITSELLKVERAEYQTTECRNIALGHAIKSFDQFFDQIGDKGPVIALIRKQLENTRPATRKKAERFLQKHRREIS